MLLLLYDEISKRLVRAELALKKEDFELFDAIRTKMCGDCQLFEGHLKFQL